MKKDTSANSFPETEKHISYVWFALLLVLYLTASLFTTFFARSGETVMIGNNAFPVSAFAGVCSPLANLCIIFLVVFFKKPGFFTSLVILLGQFPLIIISIFIQHNYGNLPGLFSNLLTITAIFLIYQKTKKIDDFRSLEIKYLKDQHKLSQRLFEQTATALVNAIDAKDTYSHGHSMRVAEYSEKLARLMGKSDEECVKIYYTALLHDVGKIGIDDDIINKKGKLTQEEYETIKTHTSIGNQILLSISEYPYLSIGAHYHHERYDGKGYPDKLKGEDIPEVARIISLADAYDAMTSNRSYRDVIPQQLVREEIVKGAGTQFDPELAKLMQHLIDMDTEYKMKERKSVKELAGKNELYCGEYRSEESEGIVVVQNITRIHLNSEPLNEKHRDKPGLPSIVLFDSLDGRIYHDEKMIREMNYYEYCEICFDGRSVNKGVRKIQTQTLNISSENKSKKNKVCDIEAVKIKDHVLIKINDGSKTLEITVALPDSTRYAYIGLTGEYCHISDVSINVDSEPVESDYIKRIAEEISYIDGPEGDIPNVQVDGYRSDSSEGIPVRDGMKIKFHTKSLPTARLVWHCPYVDVYYSDDKKVHGENYREYALIRLDGENWESEGIAQNSLIVNKNDDFEGWDEWKKLNKQGFDCEFSFSREGNRIVVTSENFGVFIKSSTVITDGTEEIYASLTGDQVAITNIRIL